MSTFLNCDPLVSNLCTVGDYVIEWHLNSVSGTVVFVSGHGSDPAIQAQHPLVNEIVQAGTLYPVPTYVYLDGEKYTTEYEEGAYYAPDLINCMDPVVVEYIDCTTQLSPSTIYPFVLNYNNTVDVSQNKSRIFSYHIGSTTQYVAWKFDTENIADQLKIYHCTALDPDGVLIDNYITGIYASNNVWLTEVISPVDYPNNPKIFNYAGRLQYAKLKNLVDLTGYTYAPGDFLKIEIIGSIYDPTNNNTNWHLSLKCLESFNNTDFKDLDISTINPAINPTLTFYAAPSCNYSLSYQMLESADNVEAATACDILKYLTMTISRLTQLIPGTGASGSLNGTAGGIGATISLPYITSYVNSVAGAQSMICTNIGPNTVTLNKTNGNLQLVFTNINDYNNVVSNIANIQATSQYIAAIAATPTELPYYSYYYLSYLKATTCGDASVTYTYSIHVSSVITYDSDNLTINMTCPTITNQWPDPIGCDSAYTTCNNNVTAINNSATLVTSQVSTVKYTNPFYLRYIISSVNHPTGAIVDMRYNIPADLYDNILPPADMGDIYFCLENSNTQWRRYKQYDRFKFLDTSTPEARLANWTLERQKRTRTGLCTDLIEEANYELVYQLGNTTTTTTTAPATTTTTTTTP